MKGTLALVGSGEYLPPMEPVDRLLLSRVPGEPRVVCLPTAAGTEGLETIARWSRLGVEHFTRLGARTEAVEVIDQATADDEALAARIRTANFVYLSGGKPDYLLKTLSGSAAWRAIESVLEGGGVVAGCSAGAIIFSEQFPNFPIPWPWQHAFNYLPGTVILPHYDEIPEAFLKAVRAMMSRRLSIVGVEGDTALVCHDGRYEVAGSGGVTVWSGVRKTRFTQGQAVVWP